MTHAFFGCICSRKSPRSFGSVFLIVAAITFFAMDRSSVAQDDWPKTIAEASNYKRTSSSAEVAEYLTVIADRAEHVQLESVGKTAENRDIWCCQIGPTPTENESDRLRVLVIGNIHSGECAGKEGLLELLRELAQTPDHPWLQQATLYVIPNYSADANDRLGENHRPGQVGPSHGMGVRETPLGLDLNRDFMKLEAPETRALVGVINRLEPHVFIDCHTTNGSKHRYELTYDVPHHPSAPTEIVEMMRSEMMPVITERLTERGIDTFYYGNFNRDRTRWSTYGYEPRYSTDYAGLRGIFAVLSEAYSYADYPVRIEASREFVREVIQRSVELRVNLIQAYDKARQPQDNATDLTLTAKLSPFSERATILGYDRDEQDEDIELEFWGRYTTTDSTELPREYWLAPDQSWIAERLQWHGIPIYRLEVPTTQTVSEFKIRTVTKSERAFQQHRRPTVTVERIETSREFPVGTYVVRLEQQSRLIGSLLEPAASDSLVSWNFFDDYLSEGSTLPYVAVGWKADKAPAALVQQIEPTEQLTVEKIYGPTQRVNYSGSSTRGVRWELEGDWYTQTLDGRDFRIQAATGTRERAKQPQRPADVQQRLSELESVDEDAAKRIAGKFDAASTQPHGQVINDKGDLYYIPNDPESAVIRVTSSEEIEELADLSPSGKHVAFIRDNNLVVFDLVEKEEVAVTTDGTPTMFNGKLDWVYQEELYGRGNFKGFWWSPSGKAIAYLKLDEADVGLFTVTDHIPVRQDLEVTPYPKAGDPNPKVSLGVYRLGSGSTDWVDLSVHETDEPLISRVGWTGNRDRVIYQVQDREQTFLDVCIADVDQEKTRGRIWFSESSPAWIETPGDPTWLEDDSFLWLSPRDGHNHLYHYDANGKLIQQLTSGAGEVREILGVNEELGKVWIHATFDTFIEQHGYAVDLKNSGATRLTELGWNHTIQVSPTGRFCIDSASQAGRPTQVRLLNEEGKAVRLVTPNEPDRLRHLRIRQPEFKQIEARDGKQLNAMLIKPYDFDPHKKYPVLVHVYSGPQAPTVRNRWQGSRYLWHQFLAQQGYVIWMCDNRSSTYGGIADAWPIHRDLGRLELRDIEDGIEHLKQQPWVDASRIGIWGWSYGGYMTAYALTHSETFKAGVAGAPVTDWANYDTIYTERYMGTPANNPEGYRDSSVVAAAENLHGRLLLVHGSMDDNVHLSNTMQLAYELQKHDQPFELMVYPKSRHGVTQPELRLHLWKTITRFLLERL